MNNDTLRNYQYLPKITTYYYAIVTYSIALISADSNSEPETKENATGFPTTRPSPPRFTSCGGTSQ